MQLKVIRHGGRKERGVKSLELQTKAKELRLEIILFYILIIV
jgi:hypothetical protein